MDDKCAECLERMYEILKYRTEFLQQLIDSIKNLMEEKNAESST